MSKIITTKFSDDFIERLTEYIKHHYIDKQIPLDKLAVVFGGRRPALFLKRSLSSLLGTSYYPPKFFTIDEFISNIVSQKDQFTRGRDLDHCFTLFKIAMEITPEILTGRESFAQFLPWSREILAFIDHLDLENVSSDKLKGIEANASIGYPVPEDVNLMLEHIVVLREAYHQYMHENKVYSRGFQYQRAALSVNDTSFDEFHEILFCNFFYFHKTEEEIIKNLYEREKASLIFQGDERKWPVLKKISNKLETSLMEDKQLKSPGFHLKLYSGFDAQSQVGMVREILKKIKNYEETVIVLPNPEMIIALISEVASLSKDFNISMGYPLRRSSLYSLFECIFNAQLSKSEQGFYTRDYLKVMRHPLIKNLKIFGDESFTRILIHNIEECLTKEAASSLAGRLFVHPDDILQLSEIYDEASLSINSRNTDISPKHMKENLDFIHKIAFHNWEVCRDFESFAECLNIFMQTLLEKSFIAQYPLNCKIASKILDVKEDLQTSLFSKENFTFDEMYHIFDAKVRKELVRFSGSPLGGLQILGLLETRSLNFKNVIIIDTNEGVLPHLNIHRHFIPREVMISLNLDRLEMEEEIQRYQFMRLISSAENVHLVYEENKNKEKSRFVEELIWEKQKQTGELSVIEPVRASFNVKMATQKMAINKTPEVLALLKDYRYSASSINTYLRSPIDFYYKYVLGLKGQDDLLNEPENREVGVFVHNLLEDVYKKYVGRKPNIDTQFRKKFKKMLNDRFDLTLAKSMKSDAFLLKSVLDSRLERFLDNEAQSPERIIKKILFVEEQFEDKIPLSCATLEFVYKVDRVDELNDGTIMLIDYKTGSIDPMPKAIEHIETMELSRETIADNVKSFQIPLYFFYLERFFKDKKINASFYNLRTLECNKFIDKRMLYDRERIQKAFLRALDFIMSEILNPEIPFCDDEITAPALSSNTTISNI